MKKKYILAATILCCTLLSFEALTFSSGAPGGRSGSPASGNQTCTGSGCHNGGPAISTQTIVVSTDIPTTGFLPNTDYTVTVTLDGNGATVTKGGFEASIEAAGASQGTLSVGAATDLRIASASFITHTNAGTAFTGNAKTYTFSWNSGTAPDQTTIYVAANFSNNNGGNSGDAIGTETLVLTANSGLSLTDPKNVVIKMYPNPVSTMLNLENVPSAVQQLNVLNIKGQKVRSVEKNNSLEPGFWEISVAGLPKGLYFVSSPNKSFETLRVQVK